MKTKTPLRVLVVEDSESDTLFMMRELRRAGFDPTYAQVSSESMMESALQAGKWDVVLSDNSMPGFGCMHALDLVRQKQPDVPFIVVSGSLDEEQAVTAIKAGANDFLPKNNLHRLAASVERELREAEERRNRSSHQSKAYDAKRALLAAIVEAAEVAVIGKSLEGVILSWNTGAERMYGYKVDEIVGRSALVLTPDFTTEELQKNYEQICKGNAIERYETVRIRKEGRKFEVSVTLSPIKDAEGNVIGISAVEHDITKRKLEENTKLRLIEELTNALAKSETLNKFLAICSSCKKIRDDAGNWQKLENYLSSYSGAKFTHGICPDCIKTLYPNLPADL